MNTSFPAGLAIGLALGRKETFKALVDYAQTHDLVVYDAAGSVISLEDFLNGAYQSDDRRSRPLLLALVLLGDLVLAGLLAYFWGQGS